MKTNLAEIYKLLPESDIVDIVAKFEENNIRFKYYISNEVTRQLYVACYNSLKQFFLDNGDVNQPEDSYIYKMMFLFQSDDLNPTITLTNFDKFAKSHINGFESLKAFLSEHRFDEYVFQENSEDMHFDYDVGAMRKSLPTLGYTLLKNLDSLSKIQAINNGAFPQDIATFKHASLKVKFPNAEKNLQLAELCNLYDGNISQFDDMIALMENGVLPSVGGRLAPKAIDNLPNVAVQYINPETGSNYYLVKLPSHDPRAMMLGNITGNCQTFSNGDADPFIIDGIIRPNNGFYVIIKQSKKAFDPTNIDWNNLEKNGHEIVGQSYTWIGRDGKSITWEAPQLVKDRAPNIDIKEVLTAFGAVVEAQGFDRVTIGRNQGLDGVKNADTIYSRTDSHNIFQEGFRYSWSVYEHYETYASSRLELIRKQISDATGEASVSSVTSVQQGEALLNFLPGKNLNSAVKKALISCYLTKDWNLEKLESLLPVLEAKSEAELESILKHKILYEYGLTIEYALKIPSEAMILLYSLVSLPEDNIKSLVTSLDELAENITSATSILDIKRAAVKLIAKNICDEIGDMAYVDAMSENKIDFITSNYSTKMLLYKTGYTIATLAQLEDTKFATLAEHGSFMYILSNYIGQTIQDYVEKFDSSLMMKRDLLKNFITYPLLPQITCDESLIDSLPEEKLDLLLMHKILGLPTYGDILQAAPISDIPAIKKQIFIGWVQKNNLFANALEIDIPENILAIFLSEDVMNFYEHQVKSLDATIARYLMKLENLAQLPTEKLKLLFSKEARSQYHQKIAPIEEMAVLLERDKNMILRDSLKSNINASLDQEIIKHFTTETLVESFINVSCTSIPFCFTSDRFTIPQRIKILEKIFDGNLGDEQSQVISALGWINAINDVSIGRQEEITQYILDHTPLEEAVKILSALTYGISPVILNNVEIELILKQWNGSYFALPNCCNTGSAVDFEIIKHFGLERLVGLDRKSSNTSNEYCFVNSKISLQDRIKILEYAEKQDYPSIILGNISSLNPEAIFIVGIDKVLSLCTDIVSDVYNTQEWLLHLANTPQNQEEKVEVTAIGVNDVVCNE